MLIVGNYYLFADAEAGEDGAEDFVGCDFAGYFSEIVHAFTDVLRHEVARDAAAQPAEGASDGFAGMQKGIVVARVGHDASVGVGVGNGGCFNQALLKRIDGDVGFCRDCGYRCRRGGSGYG